MIVRPLFLVLAFAALVGGCRREPNVAVKELVQSKPDDDKTAVVLDIFRHDTSVPQVREALSLLSIGLARPDLQDRVKASAESRAILERAGRDEPTALEHRAQERHVVRESGILKDRALDRGARRVAQHHPLVRALRCAAASRLVAHAASDPRSLLLSLPLVEASPHSAQPPE